jgi:hypothetical protein
LQVGLNFLFLMNLLLKGFSWSNENKKRFDVSQTFILFKI